MDSVIFFSPRLNVHFLSVARLPRASCQSAAPTPSSHVLRFGTARRTRGSAQVSLRKSALKLTTPGLSAGVRLQRHRVPFVNTRDVTEPSLPSGVRLQCRGVPASSRFEWAVCVLLAGGRPGCDGRRGDSEGLAFSSMSFVKRSRPSDGEILCCGAGSRRRPPQAESDELA